MKIIIDALSHSDLAQMAAHFFGNMVKAVVDVEKELLAVDAELHADLESLLIAEGSAQHSLWGINLYPELPGDDFIEYDSMINLKSSQGNMTRGVDDPLVREKIAETVRKRISL